MGSTAIAPVIKPTKQSKKNTGEPETTHPGKRGRKSNAEKQLQQQAVEDVDMPQQSTPEKRKQSNGNGNGNKPPKAKRKTKRERELEQLALEQERKYSPETTQQSSASASAEPTSPKVKKTIEKEKQILPSQIGIQKVREELEQAKNAGK